MKKTFVGMMAAVLLIAGCGCGGGEEEDPAVTAAKEKYKQEVTSGGDPIAGNATDLTSCGEFEAGTYSDAVVESKYAVCKDASTGDCYIKTFYPRPIAGCDMQFGTHRNGNPACFTWINNVHAMSGEVTAESQTDYRPGDTCGLTTEAYFRSKMPRP